MEAQKDIRKETDRYFKYNYPKKETIGHLERDGFSAAEIKAALAEKDFDTLDQTNADNVLYYPTLVLLIVVTMAFASVFTNAENSGVRTAFVVLALLSGATTLGYFFKNAFAILSAAVIFAGFTLWVLYSTYAVAAAYEEWRYPFKLALLVAVILALFSVGNYRFYSREK